MSSRSTTASGWHKRARRICIFEKYNKPSTNIRTVHLWQNYSISVDIVEPRVTVPNLARQFVFERKERISKVHGWRALTRIFHFECCRLPDVWEICFTLLCEADGRASLKHKPGSLASHSALYRNVLTDYLLTYLHTSWIQIPMRQWREKLFWARRDRCRCNTDVDSGQVPLSRLIASCKLSRCQQLPMEMSSMLRFHLS